MTNIEWTDATWNPVRGCSRVSRGCERCYAERQAMRHAGPGRAYEGLVREVNGHPAWTGEVRCVTGKLTEPLAWRKPRRVFVNSMGDLFHESVPIEFIDQVFAVMAASPRHTFQILTKRADWMRDYLSRQDRDEAIGYAAMGLYEQIGDPARGLDRAMTLTHRQGYRPPSALDRCCPPQPHWPLPNVWLGVSVEDQRAADERIPLLLQTPAALRFVSCEPLLGPVDLERYIVPRCSECRDWYALLRSEGKCGYGKCPTDGEWCPIDWVIVGGESGPGARPCDVAWIRSIVRQCRAAGVPCFVKQFGARPYDSERGPLTTPADVRLHLDDRKGADMAEWPDDLRVREWPA